MSTPHVTRPLYVGLDHSHKQSMFWASAEHMATPVQLQRLHALLEVPGKDRADFELALRTVTVDDVDLIAMALECGIVQGDWRRQALRNVVTMLSKTRTETAQPRRAQRARR